MKENAFGLLRAFNSSDCPDLAIYQVRAVLMLARPQVILERKIRNQEKLHAGLPKVKNSIPKPMHDYSSLEHVIALPLFQSYFSFTKSYNYTLTHNAYVDEMNNCTKRFTTGNQ